MFRRSVAVLGMAMALATLPFQRAHGAETQAADKRTQIVLQWVIDAATDISQHEVWSLEDRLEAESEGLYDVDSHDFGTGIVNVFLYAGNPDAAIGKVIRIYLAGQLRPGMRIGVQDYDQATRRWEYRPVYPRGLHRFDLVY
jgi:hypothetical protein